MTAPPISPRVLNFIAAKIDSIAELETLLIMSDDAHRLWSETEIAARLYTAPANALTVLESLTRRELITAEGKPAQFRFAPAHSDDHKLFAEVAEAYRRNLVAITTFIHSKASASVKEFARAFDLKKDQ
jgi:hypothetical protein